MGLFSIFNRKLPAPSSPLKVDMHSHLLPGIDDGSKSMAETIQLIVRLNELGFEKLYTTPHIMQDYYKNSPEIILPLLAQVQKELEKRQINVRIEAAAEYYLDEGFVKKLDSEKLLTFGDNYLLVETSYMNKPRQLEEVFFKLKTKGYKPILAHPERYVYMYDDFSEYEKLYERGILFQLNINSLTGYYSPKAKQIAEKLIDQKMINFAGTDCHAERHLERFSDAIHLKHYHKLLDLDLLNYTL